MSKTALRTFTIFLLVVVLLGLIAPALIGCKKDGSGEGGKTTGWEKTGPPAGMAEKMKAFKGTGGAEKAEAGAKGQ